MTNTSAEGGTPNEVLVKGRVIHINVPLSLKHIRAHTLPRFRRANHYPSLTAAESFLLRESLGYVRAVFSSFPSTDWVYDHFTERGIDEREVALQLYEEKVRRIFEPHTWGVRVDDISVRLYEDVTSALYEIVYAYSVPVSFVYSLALAKGLMAVPTLARADRQYLERLLSDFERRIEDAKAWVSQLDVFVGLPPYLRVASFLEPGQLYTEAALSVVAMSVGVIHSGQTSAQRHRVLSELVTKLIADGYLQEVPNRAGTYLCVKTYGGDEE